MKWQDIGDIENRGEFRFFVFSWQPHYAKPSQ